MALPKVQTPTFTLTLPSNKKKVTYRPFQVREEKILLIAQESDTVEDQMRAIKQVINNCILEPTDIDVEKLASYDIEYLFLKLRAKSVGEVVTIKVSPQGREGLPMVKREINIDELEPYFDPAHTDTIDIGGGLVVKMNYPTLEMLMKYGESEKPEELFNLFRDSIGSIIEGDTVYETQDFSLQEVEEFLESLSSNQLQKLRDFFTTLPKIKTTVHYKWTNPEDSNDTYSEDIEVEGLLNFLS